jgi:uncharacterized membrane protein
MSLEAFVIRLIIAIGVIWLAQFLTTELGIKEPARKWIVIVVAIIAILFLAGIGTGLVGIH